MLPCLYEHHTQTKNHLVIQETIRDLGRNCGDGEFVVSKVESAVELNEYEG